MEPPRSVAVAPAASSVGAPSDFFLLPGLARALTVAAVILSAGATWARWLRFRASLENQCKGAA
jgi:hypothetical protein